HRPVPSAHSAALAGGGVLAATGVFSLPRIRRAARVSGGVQRAAGAELVHGGEHRGGGGVRKARQKAKVRALPALRPRFLTGGCARGSVRGGLPRDRARPLFRGFGGEADRVFLLTFDFCPLTFDLVFEGRPR